MAATSTRITLRVLTALQAIGLAFTQCVLHNFMGVGIHFFSLRGGLNEASKCKGGLDL
jgi:hypothetical protein